LITIDLVLYGTSLLLEFAALVVLRVREPELERPFRAGGLWMACALGVGPAALIGYALVCSHAEQVKLGEQSVSALAFAAAVGLLGPVLYGFTRMVGRQRVAEETGSPE
ncbi:MAG: APC family permease, partial [Terracidiphilus sp.]